MHLDVMVDDLAAGDTEVLALGARPLGGEHLTAYVTCVLIWLLVGAAQGRGHTAWKRADHARRRP